jgi:LacI family transcriptional regulator
LDYTAPVDRLQGYRDALADHRLPAHENRVRFGDFSPESGYAGMQSLLQKKPYPQAVFVASDVVAIGAIAAIHETGLRIPQDIALVGFDDVPLARYLDPPLTSVHLPTREMSRLASQMVVDLIQGRTPEKPQILLKTDLVVRKSCGAA